MEKQEMLWSKDIPRVDGFYWWREGNRKKTFMVCLLKKADLKVVQLINTDKSVIDYNFLDKMKGEWAGPIVRPVEQTILEVKEPIEHLEAPKDSAGQAVGNSNG